MKKIYITVLTLSIIVMSSCDSGFDELNTSKTGATSLNPALILNNAIINASPHSGQLNWELGIVQQLISPNTGVLEGANFNKNNPNSSVQNWQGYYRNVVKYTADIIDRTSAEPARSNQTFSIWRYPRYTTHHFQLADQDPVHRLRFAIRK